MKKRTAYIFFVLLVITGILYTWDFNKTRTSHGLFDVFLFGFYSISFLTFFILGIAYHPKRKFVILSVSIFVLIIAFNILLQQDFMKSKTVLSVQLHDVNDSIPQGEYKRDLTFKLDFKKNNRCILHEGHLDFSYSYPYDYYISNDSITINEEIVVDSDNALSNKYVLDRKNKIIIPVEKDKNKLPCLQITYDNLNNY